MDFRVVVRQGSDHQFIIAENHAAVTPVVAKYGTSRPDTLLGQSLLFSSAENPRTTKKLVFVGLFHLPSSSNICCLHTGQGTETTERDSNLLTFFDRFGSFLLLSVRTGEWIQTRRQVHIVPLYNGVCLDRKRSLSRTNDLTLL